MPRVHQRKKTGSKPEPVFPKLLLTVTTELDGDTKITESRFGVSVLGKDKADATANFWHIAKAEADTTDGEPERVNYFQEIVAQEEKFKRVLVKKDEASGI